MCSVALDDDLQALAGFPAIEDTEPEVDPDTGPEVDPNDINELARDIEASIGEWQEYIDEDMPDFMKRTKLDSPITVSQLIAQHKNE